MGGQHTFLYAEREEENYDLLYKIPPSVTHISFKLALIPMDEKLAMNEQMLPFKRRKRLQQYVIVKPRKSVQSVSEMSLAQNL